MAEFATTIIPTPRARVQGMMEYHPPLGSRDNLRLDFNENTLACSPKVKEALAAVSAGSLTRYPEREPVEAMVAAHLGLKAEQVALTNGVDEAIHVLFEAFLEEGDELLLPVPTYTMYEIYAASTDARTVTVLAGDDLVFPFERLLAAITPRTKLIILNSPANPTGGVTPRDAIDKLVAGLARFPEVAILSDEIYGQMTYDNHRHQTLLAYPEIRDRLILLDGWSKTYAMTGWRR